MLPILNFVEGGVATVVTVTVVLCAVVPPAPVHVSVYVVFIVGDTASVFDVAMLPVQPFEAVQEVALDNDQVKVEEPPAVIDVGDAEMVTFGAGIATVLFTVTDTPLEVVVFPAESLARAARVWVALLAVVVSQDIE